MDYEQHKLYGEVDDTDYSILYGPEFDPEYLFGDDFDINNPEYMAGWITGALAALRGAGKGVRAIGRAVRKRRGRRGGRRRRRRVGKIARKIFARIKARRAKRKRAGKGVFRKIAARVRARRKKRGYVRKTKLFRKLRKRRLARRAKRKARRSLPKTSKSSLRDRIRARRAARKARLAQRRSYRKSRGKIKPFKMLADNIAQSYRNSINPNDDYAQRTRQQALLPQEAEVYNVPSEQKSGLQMIMAGQGMKLMIIGGIGLFVLSQVIKPKTYTVQQSTP